MMRQMLTGYQRLLEMRPYSTHSITAGSLFFAGDMLAQGLERRHLSASPSSASPSSSSSSEAVDWTRAAIMTGYGFVFAGPAYAFWYRFLDRRLTPLFINNLAKTVPPTVTVTPHMQKWKLTISKLLADFLLFDPVFLVVFFGTTTLATTRSLDKARDKLRQEFVHTYLTELKVWGPVQMLNFRFVHVNWQPVLVNMCNVGWNGYLTHVQAR
eukprot:Partr_v1_DN24113_c0_g1_i2_m71258 putative peroxisomal membrane protein